MTGEEWLACVDPSAVLEFLKGKTSDRKMRLLAVACCRQVWHLLTDIRNRTAVEMAEVYAEGGITDERLLTYHDKAYWLYESLRGDEQSAALASRDSAWCFVEKSLAPGSAFFATNNCLLHLAEIPRQSSVCLNLLQDVFRNPFRPITLNPFWQTSTVLSLAQGIYEDRAFDRMPILSDALQDTGCDNEDILTHCRGSGPHVRGCWVVDLVLGKE
ncbi:hypothetical protein [Fimbriiglobus ruber]|uniref:hypothetical protein n=1 Tax=Fimbriiglobus ruber TaxID=1908690 RepID=UPI001EE76935|nr:hypothetical protein [Fimbriiglobus ruber]